ncbi:hypothetical protein TGMAS_366870 [Toxoplasma gondii MAS]|uniref:Uncharacterized protein n=2 Tax=Toxoplasma gondii TaxID=5811 RepID=A0A086QHB8_TOXGO|nr:hypothetical protein TGMAS_366870 [Toxoplasma gondii MAS]PUA90132.1 hypothetical protein TGBR9_366870 [Toxoplasma gondii TgCATBr9]
MKLGEGGRRGGEEWRLKKAEDDRPEEDEEVQDKDVSYSPSFVNQSLGPQKRSRTQMRHPAKLPSSRERKCLPPEREVATPPEVVQGDERDAAAEKRLPVTGAEKKRFLPREEQAAEAGLQLSGAAVTKSDAKPERSRTESVEEPLRVRTEPDDNSTREDTVAGRSDEEDRSTVVFTDKRTAFQLLLPSVPRFSLVRSVWWFGIAIT